MNFMNLLLFDAKKTYRLVLFSKKVNRVIDAFEIVNKDLFFLELKLEILVSHEHGDQHVDDDQRDNKNTF